MLNKMLITVLVLSVIVTNSATVSEAQEPIYDQDGNLILDIPQEAHKDLSTKEQEPAKEVKKESEQVSEPKIEQRVNKQDDKPAVSSYNNTNSNVATVANYTQTSSTQGVLSPSSSTYLSDNSTSISAQGTLNIDKVDIDYSVGLSAGTWSISGNTLVFDENKLKTADAGTYVFVVTFVGGSTAHFELRVIAPPIKEDYWSQNIDTFNKNSSSHDHRDLEAISSAESLNVQSLTLDGANVPKSSYKVVGNSIIIDKGFLSTLVTGSRAQFKLVYNDGTMTDILVEIIDEAQAGNSIQPVGC